jgi:serine/threonine protein phosphatase PrpC
VGCLAEPEVQTQVLDKSHQFLIIASDGVWDVMNNDQATEAVQQLYKKPQQAVDAILLTSLERWGEKGQADNIGIVMMRFR